MKKNLVAFLILLSNLLFSQPTLNWAYRLGSSTYNEAFVVAQDSLGYLYTTGVSTGTVDFDPGPGVYNFTGGSYVMKTDSLKNFIWVKAIGVQAYSMAIGKNGNSYLAGRFTGTIDVDPGVGVYNLVAGGTNSGFVLKLDSAGNFLWAEQIGGVGQDRAYVIVLDKNENVFVSGFFSDTVDFDPGPGTFNLSATSSPTGKDMFIQKLDSSGNLVWVKEIDGDAHCHNVLFDGNDNLILTGDFTSVIDANPGSPVFNLSSTWGLNYYDHFFIKLDSSGSFLWAVQTTFPAYVPVGTGVAGSMNSLYAIDSHDNIYAGGSFAGSKDFDPGPGTYFVNGGQSHDVFVLKLNSLGNFVWVKSFGTFTGGDKLYELDLDQADNIYLTGQFDSIVDFDPGTGIFNLAAGNGNDNVFMQKMDSSGNFLWAYSINSNNTNINSFLVDKNESIYAVGRFTGTVDFDPGPSSFNLTSAGFDDIFVVKLNPDITAGFSENLSSGIEIYPNPAQDFLIIGNISVNSEINIFDFTGRLVLWQTSTQAQQTINTSSLQNGIFLLVVNEGNLRRFEKIIISR